MKYLTLLLVSFITLLSCKSQDNGLKQKLRIEETSNEIFNSLVKIRRDIHMYPETAGQEKRTAKVIEEYLLNLGLEVKTNIGGYALGGYGLGGYGIVGILKGNNKGKNIAWRADMDAITSDYPDEVSYKSKHKGIQHGCGHDIHIAIGLGIAEVLAKNKDLVNGTVYFIFQPEEETFVGAKNMLNSSLFSEIDLDEIYSLHVTALPVGQILVKPNELYAYQKRVQLVFNEGFLKEDATALYEKIRKQMLRKMDGENPWDIRNAFDAKTGLTNSNTTFKDYLFMEENFAIKSENNQLYLKAYLYETDQSNLINIIPKIKEIISNSVSKEQNVSVSYIEERPTVSNDEILTNKAITTLRDIYGNDSVEINYGKVPYFNDDFCYFQEKTPGVYFLLGGSNSEKGIDAMNHFPNFRVDEECIKIGVKSFSSLILKRINNK